MFRHVDWAMVARSGLSTALCYRTIVPLRHKIW